MPLRDHFRAPLDDRRSWDEVHGQWPAMIVLQLFPLLPPGYEASPRVHLGSYFEIDIAAFEHDESGSPDLARNGGAATALEAPPKPSLTVETDLLAQDEYEVRVYDARRGRRLVAAIEIVSPANKDRPEHRAAFAAKCLALLQQHVSVSIVDPVTIRDFNFYRELLNQMGRDDPALSDPPPSLYAVTCRIRAAKNAGLLDTWTFPLAIGQPLPKLPICLSEETSIPLDLESSYEETCRVLRIT
ncbi:MAG: DUF4058 family protein [Gemmataceae bacterium]|nr:DUF4058 family protein [Gemmataceae bacterium]